MRCRAPAELVAGTPSALGRLVPVRSSRPERDINAYLSLLKRDGTVTLVGLPPRPLSVGAFPLWASGLWPSPTIARTTQARCRTETYVTTPTSQPRLDCVASWFPA